MTKEVSKSPERHTFQKEGYLERCKESGEEPNPDYVAMYDDMRKQDEINEIDPKWQKDNLEYDLRTTDWILEKVRTNDAYAQNLYAAMCNMQWCKRELWPILAENYWHCSWRYAGGIIADMQQKGDYIDWYCSGMGGIADYQTDPEEWQQRTGYVPEGTVTEEIQTDLNRLGWIPVPYSDKDL